LSGIYFFQLLAERVQVIEDDAMLNDGMRVFDVVEVAPVVTVDRACIHSLVDAQQCHAYMFEVVIGEGPETTVSVSIFGADSGMHYECSIRRNGEHAFLQQRLAPRNHDVRPTPGDELLRFFAIGAGGVQDGNQRTQSRVIRTDLYETSLLPAPIAGSVHQPVIQAECQYVRKTANADPFDLAANAFPHSTVGLMQDHNAHEV